MKIIKNHNIGVISWISTLPGGGKIQYYYEPETLCELEELCGDFYLQGYEFDLIGHTSNTLYMQDYGCVRMVSTRKLNKFKIRETEIFCECGTSVRQLSLAAIENGIKGYDGLIDLPGTVAASVYGNAGCYGCSISKQLKEATILTEKGEVLKVGPEWFAFRERSSALKRGDKKAIILSLLLVREEGEVEELRALAERNHRTRRATQPESKNSLGSIFSDSGKPTILYWVITAISKIYEIILHFIGKNKEIIAKKRKHLTFVLLGAADVEPYVRQWNWYQWQDARAHQLFWKYVNLHRRMFTRSEFEIEIKHNPNFKIP